MIKPKPSSLNPKPHCNSSPSRCSYYKALVTGVIVVGTCLEGGICKIQPRVRDHLEGRGT